MKRLNTLEEFIFYVLVLCALIFMIKLMNQNLLFGVGQ